MLTRVLGAFAFAFFAVEAAAAPFAYIPNYNDDTVSVIDLASNQVIATVPVGDQPQSVAISKDGSLVYVACRGESSVDVISGFNHQFLYRYDVCEPKQIALDDDDNYLVASSNCKKKYWSGFISHWEARTYRVTLADGEVEAMNHGYWTLAANVKLRDKGIAYTFGSSWIGWVISENDEIRVNTFGAVNPGPSTAVGNAPYELVRNTATTVGASRMYVTNRHDDSVSVLTGNGTEVLVTIQVGDYPHGLGLSPDGERLYVTNRGEDSVSVVDLTTNLEVTTIPVGNEPLGVSVHPLGTFVYVANSGSDVVSVIDTQTFDVVTNILVGDRPIGWGTFVTPLAAISASPSYHHFGVTDVPLNGSTRTFTIRNEGSADLTLWSVQAVGQSGDDFQLVSTTCSAGIVLGAQESCSAVVQFTPQAHGLRTGYLQVGSNDPQTADFRVPLQGTGLASDIALSAAGNMGSVTLGESGTKTIEISNLGNAVLQIGGIGASDPLDAPFSFTTDCSNTTLEVFASCTLNVSFEPTNTGNAIDTLSIPSNDPDEGTLSFTVQAIGSAVPVGNLQVADTVEPPLDLSLYFNDTDVGQQASHEVLLFNTGSINALEVSAVSLTGAGASQYELDFTAGEDDACGDLPITVPGPVNPMIPPQLQPKPCHIGVTYAPTVAGDAPAELVVVSNTSSGEDAVVSLFGRGLGPEIEVPAAIDLGAVPVDESYSEEVNIQNLGTTSLTISDLRVAGADTFGLQLDEGVAPCLSADFSLAAGHGCTVAVSYAPDQEGTDTAVLLMETNDVDEASLAIDITAVALPRTPDAGTLEDAGSDEDGGGGRDDGGVIADAGPDGGAPDDGGTIGPPDPGGCGCEASPSQPPWAGGALMALVAAGIWRRRRSLVC